MAQSEAPEAAELARSDPARDPDDVVLAEPAAAGSALGDSHGTKKKSKERTKKSKRNRRRVRAALGAVGLLVIGGVLPPTVAWIYNRIDKLTVDAPAACKDEPQLLHNDFGVSSDISLRARPSTTSGCFTATGIHLVDGQDFSGYIEWTNRTRKQEDNVSVKLALPDGVTVVPGTSVYVASNHPRGAKFSDGLATTGLNLGSYAPGANVYVQFDLHFSAPESMRCGTDRFGMFGYRVGSKGPQLNESVPLTYSRAC